MKLSVISAVLLSLVFAYAEPTTPAEEKTNPEIEKIDKRLEELKTIWRQEQAIINGYTKNRTKAVREGSPEYHACVKAAQRTKLAEEEAAKLKEKRAALESAPEKTTPGGEATVPELAALNPPHVIYERAAHGPKIKGFFIGMDYGQFSQATQKLFNDAEFDPVLHNCSTPTGSSGSYSLSYAVQSKPGIPNFYPPMLRAEFDTKGTLTELTIPAEMTSRSFKSGKLTIDEFVDQFNKAYALNLQFDLNFQDSSFAQTYRTVTDQGQIVQVKEPLKSHLNAAYFVVVTKTLSKKGKAEAFD